jgi:hypothetical protein
MLSKFAMLKLPGDETVAIEKRNYIVMNVSCDLPQPLTQVVPTLGPLLPEMRIQGKAKKV